MNFFKYCTTKEYLISIYGFYRSSILSSKLNFAIIFVLFIALIAGNTSSSYSIDNHTKHGSTLSVRNQQNVKESMESMPVNSSSTPYAQQIMKLCQDDGDHCPMMALNELNKTESYRVVLSTFSDLVRMYDENNYSCHHEGHHLGMWLYDYTRNLTEALKYATIQCGGSVYHGIFQSYFDDEQIVHHIDKGQIEVNNLCPIGQVGVNWLHERDCIHGIGHGLVKSYDYNTSAAVDRCNEFIPLWAQSACSRGVFMENGEHFFETGEGDFDRNDIYSPCNKTVEKFASQCYFYYPGYNIVRNNFTLENNLTDAFGQCDNISPGEFAKYCYQGIGRLLEPIAYANPELAIAACNVGNQVIYHNDCLIGTLKGILKGDAKSEVGFKFCGSSNTDFKTTCYEIVGMWIKSFLYPSKSELEHECAKAPDSDYIVNCMKANPETRIDIHMFEPV